MNSRNPFLDIAAESELSLPAADGFAAAGHRWSQPEIDALILALAARRPLLVRGEAGSGKSQIARAAAIVLGSSLLVEVIHPRFEALDLLYRVDQVERLADAQIVVQDPTALDRSNRKYVKHGSLWRALELMSESDAPTPVLLIDEIDKADSDLPNALLDVLGNRSFRVPLLGNEPISAASNRLPLIVVTTNEERELPAAFVRRCAVLNLNPPQIVPLAESDQAFLLWLIVRGAVHRHLSIDPDIRIRAADQVLADRKVAVDAGYPPVGLAEYMDLLTAIDELTRGLPDDKRATQQKYWLDRLSAYALVKNAGQKQGRAPIDNQQLGPD